MTSLRSWNTKANAIFLRLREIRDPEARAKLLCDACSHDTGLEAEVRSLLAASESAGSFLEAPPTDVAKYAGDAREPESAGSWIGPYRLLERIGQGGFGEVWAAEQRTPLRRRVALKILKPGMDSKEVLARFEVERQSLALMDHPNVAKVFDAGQSDAGRPYVVMEHVPGLPINEYCDTARLRIQQRLELFVRICHAVQHAHTKGIVHRDLKPSNILVTLVDGKPVPKVIDFGIAKATSTPLTDRTLYTQVGRLMGTPEYMSPEQAATSGMDVDTRTDVYSLGVVLYQLLTGTLPFDSTALRRADYASMVKFIREQEPPRPSTRLSTLRTELVNQRDGASPDALARDRDVVFSALQRQIRGELDWIVMKCLEKDRARRYETANSLAADVQRHLSGEPIVAAPPSRLYRARKALHRYRVAVTFAAAVVVLAATGAVISLALWQRSEAARDAESRERARAEAIGAFLRDMLTAADPAKTKGEKLTVRDALDEAARRIDDSALTASPRVQAGVRETIGEAYFSLGLYPQAQAQLLAAEAMLSRELGDDDPEVLRTRGRLAQTYAWHGDHAHAIALARPTVERQRRVLGPDHPETLRTLSYLGNALMLAQEYIDEPEQCLREALAAQTRVLGRDDENTIETLNYLSWALADVSDESVSLAQEAFERSTRKFGPEHPHALVAMLTLGLALDNGGQRTEALQWRRRALEATQRVFGENHHRTADCLADLSYSLFQFGEFSESERYARRAIEIARQTYGPGAKWTLRYTRGLNTLLRDLGRHAEGLDLLETALGEARRALGDEDFETLNILIGYVNALSQSGRTAEATQLAARGFEIALRKAGPAHKWTRDFGRSYAVGLWSLGRRDEALKLLRDNLAACRAARGSMSCQTLLECDYCAEFLLARGKQTEAEALAREAVAGYRSIEPKFRRSLENPLYTLAQILAQLGQAEEALGLAVESARVPNARAAPVNYAARLLLSAPDKQSREIALALEFAERASELTGKQDPFYLGTLAQASLRAGDSARARENWDRACGLSPDDKSRARTLNNAAWELLTVTPETLRDSRQALDFALQANQLSRHENPPYLDTLALAYHRTGETARAIETERKAISLLKPDAADRSDYENQLREFERGVAPQPAPDKP
ncbi:MAG: tetratricopeptide repeat protein [Phycisphaerae bacterium]